ncbi:ABC-type polysaccharide/polyol phosphate transport system, ATPase component [Cohaesibacter marisflavi]|uniref:ABC-type polysaccharide/polyol phosphate transport system, ATPase component n=1 Tax=Cohaesibacter marisflavi TaxID=655353 RepID=A0A1I5IRZ8_9HYPH|nr:ABC transporter ATP-binding protein [Cohaesibacter marisflavi]SFO63277.1 ABC-type polysaccharide/polyol phosphate transport system, ATPase component [Cohaesibacter marisflavi]
MIELFEVSKYYPTPNGRHYVLKDVSLVIPDGAQVGVLGPNGTGKSTLMRLLAGVDMPNTGTIRRTGSISWPMGLANSMQGSLTGRENARFACRLQGVRRRDMDAIIDEVKDFAEIGDYYEMPVRTYSSGMRARLNFAIAMAFTFDCYIIDELTAVGDKNFKEKSAKVFKDKRAVASFIKVSHSLRELRNECNMGLVLNKGSAVMYDSIEEAIEVYERNIGSESSAPKKRPNQKRMHPKKGPLARKKQAGNGPNAGVKRGVGPNASKNQGAGPNAAMKQGGGPQANRLQAGGPKARMAQGGGPLVNQNSGAGPNAGEARGNGPNAANKQATGVKAAMKQGNGPHADRQQAGGPKARMAQGGGPRFNQKPGAGPNAGKNQGAGPNAATGRSDGRPASRKQGPNAGMKPPGVSRAHETAEHGPQAGLPRGQNRPNANIKNGEGPHGPGPDQTGTPERLKPHIGAKDDQ